MIVKQQYMFLKVEAIGQFCSELYYSKTVSVGGRSGLWPFRFVAISVVAVSVCGRYDLLPTEMCPLECAKVQLDWDCRVVDIIK